MCLGSLGLFLVVIANVQQTSHSLKLTPVLPIAQRLDLSSEAKYVATLYAAARDATDLPSIHGLESAVAALSSDEIRRLVSGLRRWSDMEARVRSTPAAMGDHAKVFESVVHRAAAGRALLGHLYSLSEQQAAAIAEFEAACPTLWEFQMTLKSLDSDGWLDCYVSLADSYNKTGRIESAGRLNSELLSRMPWLREVLESAPAQLSFHERRALLQETKRGWALAEQVRAKLNELVSELLLSAAPSQQLSVVGSAKSTIDEALSAFASEDSAVEGDDLKAAVAQTRANLAAEISTEAGHYLALMEGSLRGDESVGAGAAAEVRAVSQGFQSQEEVRQVFAYFRAQLHKTLAAEQAPKPRAARRRQSSQREGERAQEKVPATPTASYLHLLVAVIAAVVLYLLSMKGSMSSLRAALLKLLGPKEGAPPVVDESIFGEPKQRSGKAAGKKKSRTSPKAAQCPFIAMLDKAEAGAVDQQAVLEEGTEETDVCSERVGAAATATCPSSSAADRSRDVDEFDIREFLSAEEENGPEVGEWISTSHSKPTRLKRATSASTPQEQAHMQQQHLAKQTDGRRNHSKSIDGKVMMSMTRPPTKVVQKPSPGPETDKLRPPPPLVRCSTLPSPSAIENEHPFSRSRTPSPSDVRRVESPHKGPFDHIKVSWAAPKMGCTSTTVIIPDEDISDCSDSQSSPNDVTFDMDKMQPLAPQFPVMAIPVVPVYYMAGPPVSFNQMHDRHAAGAMRFPVMPFEFYSQVPMVPPPLPDHLALLCAVRAQIDYYFSAENLCKDTYLRGMMDKAGFVKLSEISRFNRIRSFGAPALMILEAVATSNIVVVEESSMDPTRREPRGLAYLQPKYY